MLAESITETHFDRANYQLSGLNCALLCDIAHNQLLGRSQLPHGLGLPEAAYRSVIRQIGNPALQSLEKSWLLPGWKRFRQRAEIAAEILALRLEEREQIVDLLMRYADPEVQGSWMVATIIASACMGSAHLWRDLGVPSRVMLRQLLLHNFPTFAESNSKDMRWKRFIYRQLCETGGDYVCRAPSCEECSSIDECFGPE